MCILQGDSGGPIMCLEEAADIWRQVGLTSRGWVCNSTSYPNIIARISSHVNFIKSFTPEGQGTSISLI